MSVPFFVFYSLVSPYEHWLVEVQLLLQVLGILHQLLLRRPRKVKASVTVGHTEKRSPGMRGVVVVVGLLELGHGDEVGVEAVHFRPVCGFLC